MIDVSVMIQKDIVKIHRQNDYYILKARYPSIEIEYTASVREYTRTANDMIQNKLPSVPFQIHMFY